MSISSRPPERRRQRGWRRLVAARREARLVARRRSTARKGARSPPPAGRARRAGPQLPPAARPPARPASPTAPRAARDRSRRRSPPPDRRRGGPRRRCSRRLRDRPQATPAVSPRVRPEAPAQPSPNASATSASGGIASVDGEGGAAPEGERRRIAPGPARTRIGRIYRGDDVVDAGRRRSPPASARPSRGRGSPLTGSSMGRLASPRSAWRPDRSSRRQRRDRGLARAFRPQEPLHRLAAQTASPVRGHVGLRLVAFQPGNGGRRRQLHVADVPGPLHGHGQRDRVPTATAGRSTADSSAYAPDVAGRETRGLPLAGAAAAPR